MAKEIFDPAISLKRFGWLHRFSGPVGLFRLKIIRHGLRQNGFKPFERKN